MLKEMPKVGDKFIRTSEDSSFFTRGEEYEVLAMEWNGVSVIDDMGDNHSLTYDYLADHFMSENEAPTPDTAALIANLALRVGELEIQNAQQAHEINELYRADAERGVLR